MNSTLQIQYRSDEPLHDDLTNWQAFTAGSNRAYEALYHKYVNELYSYACMVVKDKSLAEDVIHDVFTDLWSSRANLCGVRAPRLYLFSCVKRKSLRKLKKEKAYTCYDSAEEQAFEIAPSFLDELLAVQQQESVKKSLEAALQSLSNRQREIIYLRFYQNLSYPEIAQLLELDQKYTYNLASKAFCILRKSIPSQLVVSLLFILSSKC